MNLGTLVPRHARYRPRHTAIVFGDARIDYRSLDRRVAEAAGALDAAGLGPGDRFATVLSNCLELVELYLAAARTGCVVVPLSPLLTERGLAALLADSGAKLAFADERSADALERISGELEALAAGGQVLVGGGERPGFRSYDAFRAAGAGAEPAVAELADSDPFNIIYSSGTTGDPKGILHTHYVRAMYCTLFASAWRMTPESVVLHTGSIVFNGVFVTLMPAIYLGATFVLHAAFDADAFIDTVARERVTHTMLVPAQIVALLDHPRFDADALGSLEMLLSLGAPLHLEHKQRLNERLPGRFHELYGLTEGFVTILDHTDYARKPESVGAPPPFFELRILDGDGRELGPGQVGEICGRGPILMPGYFGRAHQTAQAVVDGWLHSGDLGYVDEDGFLYLVDRKKDMFISGGVNVYPRDVEEVLVQHPAVREATVFGAPDPRWGESAVAAVVLRSGAAETPARLRDWVNARVDAKYQRLREVLVLDEFPRNVAGKTLKRVIRDRYLETRLP